MLSSRRPILYHCYRSLCSNSHHRILSNSTTSKSAQPGVHDPTTLNRHGEATLTWHEWAAIARSMATWSQKDQGESGDDGRKALRVGPNRQGLGVVDVMGQKLVP